MKNLTIVALLCSCSWTSDLVGTTECGLVDKGTAKLGEGCFEVWPAEEGVYIGDNACKATDERHLVTSGEIHLWAEPFTVDKAHAHTFSVECPVDP